MKTPLHISSPFSLNQMETSPNIQTPVKRSHSTGDCFYNHEDAETSSSLKSCGSCFLSKKTNIFDDDVLTPKADKDVKTTFENIQFQKAADLKKGKSIKKKIEEAQRASAHANSFNGSPIDVSQSLHIEKLSEFLENCSVPVHIVAGDGKVLWANNEELESLGYTSQEYFNHHISEFHHDDDVINDILTRLTNKETLRNFPARLKRKDGRIAEVLINSNVYWDEDGNFVHTRCFTRDVTHLNVLDRAKNLAEEERKKAVAESESKGRFLALLSHEVRTPMAGILGMATSLLETNLTNVQRDDIKTIITCCQTLTTIISELLDNAKCETGRMDIVDIPFLLNDPINQVTKLYGPKAKEKGVDLKVNYPKKRRSSKARTKAADLPTYAVGDPMRLGQILYNLTSNALKFTEQGEISLSVEPLSRKERAEAEAKLKKREILKAKEAKEMEAEEKAKNQQEAKRINDMDVTHGSSSNNTDTNNMDSSSSCTDELHGDDCKLVKTSTTASLDGLEERSDNKPLHHFHLPGHAIITSFPMTTDHVDDNNQENKKDIESDNDIIYRRSEKTNHKINANNIKLNSNNLSNNKQNYNNNHDNPSPSHDSDSATIEEKVEPINKDYLLACNPDKRFWVRYKIRDTGIGIPYDAQHKLFEAFTQADSSVSREHGGTGLGLFICRRLVNLMGGFDISLFSRPGEGSLFSFILPFGISDSLTTNDDSQEESLTTSFGRNVETMMFKHDEHAHSINYEEIVQMRKKKKLLLAEDNPINILVAQKLLGSSGYSDITVVKDGQELVDLLKIPETPKFDILLLDIFMPRLDGCSALAQIRNLPNCCNKDIQAIALTADATAQRKGKCLSSGMSCVITKPFVKKEVLNMIDSMVLNL